MVYIYIYILYLGSGLGLFLCKNLCELMGGKIRMRSKFGKGTKFSFSILGNTQESIMSESQMENIEEGYLHRYSTTNVKYLYC